MVFFHFRVTADVHTCLEEIELQGTSHLRTSLNVKNMLIMNCDVYLNYNSFNLLYIIFTFKYLHIYIFTFSPGNGRVNDLFSKAWIQERRLKLDLFVALNYTDFND